jgi:hypothetical protein
MSGEPKTQVSGVHVPKEWPTSWLIIERLENWEADRAADFSYFGLSNRYKKFVELIKQDDLVFCYVSTGISAFSDVRKVRVGGLRPLTATAYSNRSRPTPDSAFTLRIETAPLLVLDRQRWLPFKDVVAQLELTRDRSDWRPLQTSIRALSKHDGALLKEALERRARDSRA